MMPVRYPNGNTVWEVRYLRLVVRRDIQTGESTDGALWP